MSYDPTALRKGLSRLGMNPETALPHEDSARGMRILDALMVEKDAVLRAYLGGAAVAAIYRMCKQHGLVRCSPPSFYVEFNHFLSLAQVPKRAKGAMHDAKRRLALKPGVSKLLTEMKPMLQAVNVDENGAITVGRGGRRARRVKMPVTQVEEAPPPPRTSTPVATGSVAKPSLLRPTAGGAVAVVAARGPLDLHRDRMRREG